MHNFWLIQANPSVYSFQNLLEERKTAWTYVKNHIGLKEIRNMKEGDVVLMFENGEDKAVVGLAEVISAPYKNTGESKNIVVDIKAIKKLNRVLPLWQIKNNPKLKNIDLWQIPELEVCSLTDTEWEEFMILSKEK